MLHDLKKQPMRDQDRAEAVHLRELIAERERENLQLTALGVGPVNGPVIAYLRSELRFVEDRLKTPASELRRNWKGQR